MLVVSIIAKSLVHLSIFILKGLNFGKIDHLNGLHALNYVLWPMGNTRVAETEVDFSDLHQRIYLFCPV